MRGVITDRQRLQQQNETEAQISVHKVAQIGYGLKVSKLHYPPAVTLVTAGCWLELW